MLKGLGNHFTSTSANDPIGGERKGSEDRPQREVRRVVCITPSILLTADTGRIHGDIQRHLDVT